MTEAVSQPWPWYVAGPLIGLIVPLLLLLGGKMFGISGSFQHICAAVLPARLDYFKYDWRSIGAWKMVFVIGSLIGGFIAVQLVPVSGVEISISDATKTDLRALGVTNFEGLVPAELISWRGLASLPGLIMIVVGGFLVGFGARYAGGCTSGHAISGLADMQFPSLVAVIGFFIGGLLITHLVLPFLL